MDPRDIGKKIPLSLKINIKSPVPKYQMLQNRFDSNPSKKNWSGKFTFVDKAIKPAETSPFYNYILRCNISSKFSELHKQNIPGITRIITGWTGTHTHLYSYTTAHAPTARIPLSAGNHFNPLLRNMEGITQRKRGVGDCNHAVGLTVLQQSRLLNLRQFTYPPFSYSLHLFSARYWKTFSWEREGTQEESVLPQKEIHQ